MSPVFLFRLFKPPMRKLDSASIPEANHPSLSSDSMATDYPFLPPQSVAASCSSLGELDPEEGCSSTQQIRSVVRPLTPKPFQIQGDGCDTPNTHTRVP